MIIEIKMKKKIIKKNILKEKYHRTERKKERKDGRRGVKHSSNKTAVIINYCITYMI